MFRQYKSQFKDVISDILGIIVYFIASFKYHLEDET